MEKTVLDARGLICPLPVLRTNKELGKLAPGDLLEILATDANAEADIHAFCKSSGNELVESTKSDDVFKMTIRKSVFPAAIGNKRTAAQKKQHFANVRKKPE